MTAETSNARGEWPERYACNGPEGTFWTDDAALANKLIGAAFDRDEWTVTDTQNPTGVTPPPPAAARGDVRGLVALAEQMERDAAGCRRDGYTDAAVVKEDCAQRIRQALGISAIAEALAADGVQAGEVSAYDLAVLDDAAETLDRIGEGSAGLREARARIASALSQQPEAQCDGEVAAWETEDGRVISARQNATALRDGGASASSVAPYTTPLYRTAPPSAPVGVGASYHPCISILIEGLKRLEGGSDVLEEWDRARAKVDTAVAQKPAAGAVDKVRFRKAPCYLCGYNGPGYYQPDTHPCAAKYHATQHQEPTT